MNVEMTNTVKDATPMRNPRKKSLTASEKKEGNKIMAFTIIAGVVFLTGMLAIGLDNADEHHAKIMQLFYILGSLNGLFVGILVHKSFCICRHHST